MNLHQIRNIAIFMTKKYIFWLQTADKVIKTVISSTKIYTNSTSPLKGAISPVTEDISSVEEKRKSRVGQLSLSSVTEDQSPVRVATKAGRKRHGESSGQEKRKKNKAKWGVKECGFRNWQSVWNVWNWQLRVHEKVTVGGNLHRLIYNGLIDIILLICFGIS